MTVHRWTSSTIGHMMLSNYLFIILAVIMFIYDKGLAFQPEFAEPITNLTVPLGRDATFKCLVLHLGGYRVGWVKADTKAIQAIHEHVITHNPRVGVSHEDHATWNLHIRNVQEEDRGQYMCQINTDPMKSQVGYLDVVIPPDFVPDETSGDVMLPEGGGVRLACRARGHPQPRVIWRREDGQDIILKDPMGVKNRVSSFQGEMLKLAKVARSEMGAYLCIASNGVPPSVSKRIMLNVHFHPVIQVPNQLVGAPLGTDVKLECHVEASPKSINYWIRDTGDMIVSSNKHDVQTSSRSLFEVKMTLIIRGMQPDDVGSYKCVAKNSLGEVDSYIRLYDIPGPTRKSFQPRFDEEDYPDQYGSAEREIDEENTNRVGERDKTRTSTTPVHQINNGRVNNHNNNYQNNHQNHWGTSTSSITPFVNKVHRIVSNDGGGSKTTTTHHYDNRIPVLPTSKIPQTFSSNSATTLKSLRFSLLVLSVLCCSFWFRERFKI